MENRIKDQPALFAGRMSAESFRSNQLLKIAAAERVSVHRIWITLPRSYPLQHVFRQAHAALLC